MKNIFILFGLVLVIQSGCKEPESSSPTDAAPIIEKLNPRNHQVYAFGDTAYFNLRFSDNKLLTATNLRIYLATNEELLNIIATPNSGTYAIDTFILMNDSAYSYVNFDISAVDNAGNITKQSSHIHLRN